MLNLKINSYNVTLPSFQEGCLKGNRNWLMLCPIEKEGMFIYPLF